MFCIACFCHEFKELLLKDEWIAELIEQSKVGLLCMVTSDVIVVSKEAPCSGFVVRGSVWNSILTSYRSDLVLNFVFLYFVT